MLSNPLIMLALLLLAVLVVLLLLIFLLGLRTELVKQEERLVIYRFGRFARVAGPGYVFYSTRFETIERRINVREENKKIAVDGFFINGVPFGYTFDIWLRNDPQAAAAQSGRSLAELAQFDDRERLAQTKIAIRNALLESLAQVEREHPVAPQAPFVSKLLPIFPGQPAFNELMDQVRSQLSTALPEIGVLPAPGRPITVTNINLNQQIIDGFNQGRSITLLKEALPDLKSDQLLEMVAKINGVDLNYQRVQLSRQGNAFGDVDVYARDQESGMGIRARDSAQQRRPTSEPANASRPQQESVDPPQPNTTADTTLHQEVEPAEESATPSDPASKQTKTNDAKEAPIPVTLPTSPSDWSVLKRLPR